MATFSAVTRQHILQAIAEYDSRGGDDFLGVYGFAPGGYPLLHEGRSYDSTAILGVAHRYATGRLASADEVGTGGSAVLRKRGFDVTEPPSVRRAPVAPVRRAPATRRATAAPERVAAICPTCAMVLPATGICDDCG
ncbi:hypothetical protein HP550_08250 [Cellulomonas humilata]|uniref:ScoMcrA-like N-terminal head domain-containing protein n=1 Tax=Cellulomonas humilata TaxID=144055 RepID=A0A7Y6DW81_9CELL|nr:hypothetical protein [Cellulomonas humilata]NUU17241.1 hypothetical protein [Cellulomonas humilata]